MEFDWDGMDAMMLMIESVTERMDGVGESVRGMEGGGGKQVLF